MSNRCGLLHIQCWLMDINPRLIEEGNSRVKVLLKSKEAELHRVCVLYIPNEGSPLISFM